MNSGTVSRDWKIIDQQECALPCGGEQNSEGDWIPVVGPDWTYGSYTFQNSYSANVELSAGIELLKFIKLFSVKLGLTYDSTQIKVFPAQVFPARENVRPKARLVVEEVTVKVDGRLSYSRHRHDGTMIGQPTSVPLSASIPHFMWTDSTNWALETGINPCGGVDFCHIPPKKPETFPVNPEPTEMENLRLEDMFAIPSE
jgi:hypothetical protein